MESEAWAQNQETVDVEIGVSHLQLEESSDSQRADIPTASASATTHHFNDFQSDRFTVALLSFGNIYCLWQMNFSVFG